MKIHDRYHPHHKHADENHAVLFQPDPEIEKNERRILFVLVLTAVTMIIEIAAGTLTGSMSLLADGWHMASHAGALLISWFAYRLSKSKKISQNLTFGAGKVIPLGGYTSAILLALVALFMAIESTERIFTPRSIEFNEALWVAVFGLIINLVSALALQQKSHGHKHDHAHNHVHDHNLQSAYIHVLTDALTSVLAIAALLLGKYYGWAWADPLIGLLGAVVILRWAWFLCRDTAWELMDAHDHRINFAKLEQHIEALGAKVIDVHIWRVAPQAVACELILSTEKLRGANFYREQLVKQFTLQHVVIEERLTT